MELSLHYRVDNTLSGEGELPIALSITSMDSFKPEQIARAVPQLSRLLAARNLIKDLKSNLLDNREFRKRLEEILKDPQAARSLQEQLKSLVPPHTDDTAV
jgi:type VI secretion system protein ImpB